MELMVINPDLIDFQATPNVDGNGDKTNTIDVRGGQIWQYTFASKTGLGTSAKPYIIATLDYASTPVVTDIIDTAVLPDPLDFTKILLHTITYELYVNAPNEIRYPESQYDIAGTQVIMRVDTHVLGDMLGFGYNDKVKFLVSGGYQDTPDALSANEIWIPEIGPTTGGNIPPSGGPGDEIPHEEQWFTYKKIPFNPITDKVKFWVSAAYQNTPNALEANKCWIPETGPTAAGVVPPSGGAAVPAGEQWFTFKQAALDITVVSSIIDKVKFYQEIIYGVPAAGYEYVDTPAALIEDECWIPEIGPTTAGNVLPSPIGIGGVPVGGIVPAGEQWFTFKVVTLIINHDHPAPPTHVDRYLTVGASTTVVRPALTSGNAWAPDGVFNSGIVVPGTAPIETVPADEVWHVFIQLAVPS